ncbi:hypothetical protein CUU66_11225 [Peribacillus deserti]|uniref:Uncharacterized protein n=1 Tax=Peribacillus deserti TaxID=673318 RepID=A0A2N5M631_9BACI|nr:hypothetical protein CUU66_11225 [Peribacillus deserti]
MYDLRETYLCDPCYAGQEESMNREQQLKNTTKLFCMTNRIKKRQPAAAFSMNSYTEFTVI